MNPDLIKAFKNIECECSSQETTEIQENVWRSVMVYDKKITHHTQIQKILELVNKQPLVIICEDSEQEGLAFLAMNNYRKNINVCVVKSPEFGDMKREWMEDIALLVWGDYISDIRGAEIKKVALANLGKATKVVVSKTETIIIGGAGNKEELEDLVNNLKMNLTQAETENEKNIIEKRIARLTGGIAVIQVGGTTETELRERLDRVDDSVRSTKSAIAEGFVAGGGTAFLRINNILAQYPTSKDCQQGIQCVMDSLSTPLKQICENAGVDSAKILKDVIDAGKEVGRIDYPKDSLAYIFGGIKFGYNVLTSKIEDMVVAGIIDSTKALRCALTNAASIAGMFLTSEASIITIH